MHDISEPGTNSFLWQRLCFKCFHAFNLHVLVGEESANFLHSSRLKVSEKTILVLLYKKIYLSVGKSFPQKHHQETKTPPCKVLLSFWLEIPDNQSQMWRILFSPSHTFGLSFVITPLFVTQRRHSELARKPKIKTRYRYQ